MADKEIKRNTDGNLNCMGFDGISAEDIANQIQDKLINAHIGKHQIRIQERLFWQPATPEADYSAVIFYTADELPKEDTETVETSPDVPAGKK